MPDVCQPIRDELQTFQNALQGIVEHPLPVGTPIGLVRERAAEVEKLTSQIAKEQAALSTCIANYAPGRWVPIGPRRITSDPVNDPSTVGSGGRLGAIAIDPTIEGMSASTIYVGGGYSLYGIPSGCGIWKTTTGGKSWQAIGDSLPTLTIGAIAIDPLSPSHVYVALPGFGIFRSDNGGGSWTSVSGSDPVKDKITTEWQVLLVHPKNSNVLYLTANNGVYRSSNGGTTWQLSKSGGRATGLVINPQNPDILYAAIVGDGIYQTTNGGAHAGPPRLMRTGNG